MASIKKTKKNRDSVRKYVDGAADTPYEYFMLIVILVNIVSLGLETSKDLMSRYGNVLMCIDKICLLLFIIEIIVKFIIYNKEFFYRRIHGADGKISLEVNQWNIFDLVIVIISIVSSLPYLAVLRTFRVFRSVKVIRAMKSFRIVRALKLMDGVSCLRKILKALYRALPGIIWTFVILLIFVYVYAIIGTNNFSDDFPLYFGNLGRSLLTLCQITTFDSWISSVARPIITVYAWAWLYFISYALITASVIMNVIVGIIVDYMNDTRKEVDKLKHNKSESVTLEDVLSEIKTLNEKIDALSK